MHEEVVEPWKVGRLVSSALHLYCIVLRDSKTVMRPSIDNGTVQRI